ncbi:uncharacterized protein [Manis javanica]|uniref:uncharacterized protein n=1 Tax=Manis javanica TaxID=9974 RepID=UPI003C6D2DA2
MGTCSAEPLPHWPRVRSVGGGPEPDSPSSLVATAFIRGRAFEGRCTLIGRESYQSSTLGSEEELTDGFTYSISLHLGQAAYTPGPHYKPGNLPGPSQGCPTRLVNRPTPESVEPRSRGHPREPEPSVHETDVPKRRVPRTGMRRKGRKLTGRVELAPNTSWSAPKVTLPPEDADQLTTGQRLPRGLEPGSFGKAQGKQPFGMEAHDSLWLYPVLVLIMATRGTSGDSRGVPRKVRVGLPSATIDPRQMQLAPQTRGGPAWWLEPVPELPETPVLERQPVSPASAPAEPEDVPAVALAPLAGPELEPQEPTAEPSSPRIGWARRLAWEPEHVPCAIDASQLSSTLVGRVLHHLVQEEHLGPTVAELEDLRQMHLAPETRGGPTSWLEPVQELPETPVLERRPVSPASAPAEPEDVPAEASAQGPGPELEPHEPSGLGPRALARMAPGVAEPVPDPEPTSPSAASPWDITGVVSGPELEPHESSGTGPMAPAGMAQGRAEPQVVLEPTSPCTVSTRDLPKEEEQTILAFAPRLVAEQLTLMCAELYSRVERGQCKVYVERHPLRESIVLLNPNILNVIKHFGTTFHFVISSCLGGPSTTAQDRARVVEFWIQVAKECLALRNFGSFRAIIVALQHPHVRRLENTWGHVSWKSSWIYRKLKKRNKGLKGKQLLEDARAIVRKWHQSPRASQDMKKQL